ncbi:hypothetical protein [Streptomyces sp. Tu 4128]|uniref:hypothetical protein n=1 Tax=Streptomyces sp. Tu 4128 TaxID=1120314 RepID=UPI003211CEE5
MNLPGGEGSAPGWLPGAVESLRLTVVRFLVVFDQLGPGDEPAERELNHVEPPGGGSRERANVVEVQPSATGRKAGSWPV